MSPGFAISRAERGIALIEWRMKALMLIFSPCSLALLGGSKQ
jgi:hypothetical protein